MYSETPPEKVSSSIGAQPARAGSRSTPAPPTVGDPPPIAANRQSAIRVASARASSGGRTRPSARSIPSSAPKRPPASSTRAIRPSRSRQTGRGPPPPPPHPPPPPPPPPPPLPPPPPP